MSLYTSAAFRLGWAKSVPTTLLILFCPIDAALWSEEFERLEYEVGLGSALDLSYDPAVAAQIQSALRRFRGGLIIPPPALSWSEELHHELVRRARDGLRQWQHRWLAQRLKIRADATPQAKFEVLECRRLMSQDWLRAVLTPEARAELPPPTQVVRDLATELPKLHSYAYPELREPPAAELFGETTLIAPKSSFLSYGSLVDALHAATHDVPQAVDPDEWDVRVATLDALATSSMSFDPGTSIVDAMETISQVTGAYTTLSPHDPMSYFDLHWATHVTEGGSYSGLEALELVSSSLGEVYDRRVQWFVAPEGRIWFVGKDEYADARRRVDRCRLYRVYDVRSVLRAQASSFPDYPANLAKIYQDCTEATGRAPGDALHAWNFNGRLVIFTDVISHLKIEKRLKQLRHPTP